MPFLCSPSLAVVCSPLILASRPLHGRCKWLEPSILRACSLVEWKVRAGFRQNGFFADFYFWAAGFFRGFSRRIFSPHFCGKKCPEKSSRKIPGKILQNLYNKNLSTHFCRLPRQGKKRRVFLQIDSRELIRSNRPDSRCESPGHLRPELRLKGYGYNLGRSRGSPCLEVPVQQYFEEAFCAPKVRLKWYGFKTVPSRSSPLLWGPFFHSTPGAAHVYHWGRKHYIHQKVGGNLLM